MKSLPLLIIAALSACLLGLAGCTTSSAVMAAGGGAYTITKSGTTGFTPLGVLRKEAYEEASKFAVSKGMEAEVISVSEVAAGFARWPQVDLRFRLVKFGAHEASGGKTSDLTINSYSSYDAAGNPTNAETKIVTERKTDFYAELKELGELREKGLLTEDEFQKEKKRLLDARDK